MANVLLTWELGGGLGHLTTLLPLARALRKAGHRVFAALRDLSRAEKVFAGLQLTYFQAPIKIPRASGQIKPPRTFAHILHNTGFGDVDELRTMVGAWRSVYDCVKPDLIVFNHSPTALLAARGYRARRAVVGTGFCCPPGSYPLPDLRAWLPDDSQRLRQDEDRVLDNVNRILDGWGETPLERLSELYQQVDENFLTTFHELDPYAGRSNAQYWGACPNVGGKTPVWPQGRGKRVFVYVKPFPTLPRLLTWLKKLQYPTIVYTDGSSTGLRRSFESATLHFEDQPLDLYQVGRHCDLAILNGTHGTTVSMLLAGKPTLQLPIFLEQSLNGDGVARLGAGLTAPFVSPKRIAAQLKALLSSDEYAEAARRFAARYADFNPEQQINGMVRRAEELLN